jgi:hypothetical protein
MPRPKFLRKVHVSYATLLQIRSSQFCRSAALNGRGAYTHSVGALPNFFLKECEKWERLSNPRSR